MAKLKYERIIEQLEQNMRFRLEAKMARNFMDNKRPKDYDEMRDDLLKFSSKLTGIAMELLKDKIAFTGLEKENLGLTLAFYIIRGGDRIKSFLKQNPFGLMPVPFNELLEKPEFLTNLKDEYKDGVVLFISPEVTREEILNFVSQINKVQKRIRERKPTRLRSYTKTKEHNKLLRVYNLLASKNLYELRKLAGENSYDKNSAISTILNKDYNIKIKPKTLETTIIRLKKRKDS